MACFYERFLELCKENNYSINPLLIEVGGSNGMSKNWEKGAKPGTDIVEKLADKFNVSTDYLLGKTNIRKIPDELLNVNIAFSGGKFDDLTQDEIEVLADMAKIMRSKRIKTED